MTNPPNSPEDESKDSLHFPQTLFDEFFDKSDDRRWLLLYTKSRQEKYVAKQLLSRRVPFYLPLLKTTTYSRRRKKVVQVPLFTGYMFLYGNGDERLHSLETNRISRILDVPDEEGLIVDLRRIHHMLCSDSPVTREARVAPGRRVRIRSGPLAGLEGTVVSRRKQLKIIVSVNFLQQGASVEVEDFMFETLD